MKITAVTGSRGELVAIVHAHLSESARAPHLPDTPKATLHPRPGQVFAELEAPDHLRDRPHGELSGWILEHLRHAKGRD